MRKLILLLFMIGLVLLDWGCNICGGRTDYMLSEIPNELWTIAYPSIKAYDSLSFEEAVVRINMDWDAVAMQSISNSSLMACGEHEFYYATDLPGITIRSSKSYIGSLTDNQVKIFSLRGSLTIFWVHILFRPSLFPLLHLLLRTTLSWFSIDLHLVLILFSLPFNFLTPMAISLKPALSLLL